MKVHEVMTGNPACVKTRTTGAEAWEALQSLEVRHLPVVNEDGELVGIVSDRDFGARPWPSVEMTAALGPERVRLTDPVVKLMSSNVISVEPDDDVQEVIDLMLENKIGAVPVTGPEGQVMGIVSYLDILRKLGEALA